MTRLRFRTRDGMPVERDTVLIGGGRTRRYRGLIPKIGPLAVATIAWAQVKLARR